MSLVQLESFIAVVEEGHMGRAARRLHVSQPPLTRRIKSLEDELGVSLFHRTPRGMRPSPQGAELLPRARSILQQVMQIKTTLQHPSPHCLRAVAPPTGAPASLPSE